MTRLGEGSSLDEQEIKLTNSARVSYAVGGSATGLVQAGFSMFVLFYYNNVLGLSASLVGTALAVALIFDSLSDPIVGYWSDGHRSKLGRRHPFLYFSAIPVAVCLYLLWHPPIGFLDRFGPMGLFTYLLVISISLRVFITFFDVPSNSMVPELTKKYHERTHLAGYRTAVMWGVITLLSMVVYGYWLLPTEAYPNGLLNPAGYQEMGKVAAIVAVVTILISALGTRKYAPLMHTPAETKKLSGLKMIKTIASTYSERKLIPVWFCGVFVATGFTIYASLFTYLFGYYWMLTPAQLSAVVTAWLVGVVVGGFVPVLIPKSIEKRTAAVGMLLLMIFSTCAPVVLSLLNLFPDPGSPHLFSALWPFLMLDQVSYIGVVAIVQSMMSDVVEHRQVSVGTRNEGIIFAGFTLIMKFSSAISILLAGLALDFIQFPVGGPTAEVSATVLKDLAVVYIVGNGGFYALSICAVLFYSLKMEDFLGHLDRLNQR